MPNNLDFESLMQNFPDRYQVIATDPPRWTIIAVSDKYVETVGKSREHLVGKSLFEAFPPDPSTPGRGRDELEESFNYVIEHKDAHEMPLLRYDVVDDETGEYGARFWRVTNAPICDDDGNVVAILNRPEDITELKQLQKSANAQHDKASKVGTFLLERGGLIALALFLGFASLGAVAWALAESNRNTKVQINQLKDLVKSSRAQSEQNESLLKTLQTNQDLLKDCSTPGGKCFEDQIQASSVGAALGSISGSVIVMLECALPIPPDARTPENIKACKDKAFQYQMDVISKAKNGGQR
jgi:PAS domain S-box-containing protein